MILHSLRYFASFAPLRENRFLGHGRTFFHHRIAERVIPARIRTRLAGSICCLFLSALSRMVFGAWPPDVEAALQKAEGNRAEIERFLRHYEQAADPQKRAAAHWLVANMDGHGFVRLSFYTADKTEVAFDALDYPDFVTALAAMDELEKQHGSINYGRQGTDEDLKTLSAELLIENVDLAFQAWRELPWAKEMSFETFRDFVLPYRGSEEPVRSFRPFMLQRYTSLGEKMKDPRDAREAAGLIRADVDTLIGFNELFYLHPTDQSLDEMLERKLGRCEDITNMVTYAWRANGIASASDYTPAWADRDNNHAWEVVLDEQGRGNAGLHSRAAKIYRKMFARQADALGTLLAPGEKVPRWLGGKSYADVTDQYQDVSDVTVALTVPVPEQVRFAYLCVFNGGEWTAIHYGRISETGDVTFTKMGRNIAYLPAYFVDDTLRPGASPLIVRPDGTVQTLEGRHGDAVAIEIGITAPEFHDADSRRTIPRIAVRPDVEYELFSWDLAEGDWISHGRKLAGDDPVRFEDVSGGRLYWMKTDDGRNLERIFTVEDNEPKWY